MIGADRGGSHPAPAQQPELLVAADRIGTEPTATLTSLWVEGAYVDLDRQRPEQAIRATRPAVLRTLGRPETR